MGKVKKKPTKRDYLNAAKSYALWLHDCDEDSDPFMTLDILLSDKYVIFYSQESELQMKVVDSVEKAVEDIRKSEQEDSGWNFEALFHQGKEIEVQIDISVSVGVNL